MVPTSTFEALRASTLAVVVTNSSKSALEALLMFVDNLSAVPSISTLQASDAFIVNKLVIATSRSALLASFKFNSKLLNLSGAFDLITLAWLAFIKRKLGVVTYTVPPLFSTCSELASSFNSTYKMLSRTSVWI